MITAVSDGPVIPQFGIRGAGQIPAALHTDKITPFPANRL